MSSNSNRQGPTGGSRPASGNAGSHHQKSFGKNAGPAARAATAKAEDVATAAADRFHDVLERKPLWRGWIHSSFAPVAFAAGIVLIVLAGGGARSAACAVFGLTSVVLFSVSGMYHRAYWQDKARMAFKRLDHSNISLVIAGTYTPLALTLLDQPRTAILLWSVWACALLLIVFRVFWTGAPRMLYTPLYVVMGLMALFYMADFWSVSPVATILICVGGVFYIVGAVFYALKRPVLSPQVFGFHELFHVCTILGFACHYIAVVFSIYV
ncbi:MULTISPECIES: PAQR family membrane homeostasis protein TrhA [Micrococcaceae]|uniref:PAQR family membrane homeostasis protein TrhA n=1 Tax=unclassified Kocuria TaxID=2649579 RepID=UPI00101099E4|nr:MULTISPECIES: hemolysin III family protein [unclassified Kocuria]